MTQAVRFLSARHTGSVWKKMAQIAKYNTKRSRERQHTKINSHWFNKWTVYKILLYVLRTTTDTYSSSLNLQYGMKNNVEIGVLMKKCCR